MTRDLTPELRRDRDQRTRPWLNPHADKQLRADLAHLPDLVALAAANPTPIRQGEPGPRPTPGSRPPLSLDAVAITDRRTRQTDDDVIGTSDLDRIAGRRDGIEPTIRSWVLLAEGELIDTDTEHQPIPERQGVAADCAWLLRHVVWIGEQQWAVELADAVHRMVRDCERVLRIRPEYRPRCPRCRGALTEEGGWFSCASCGQTTRDDRMSYRQALVRQEPMTAAEIAKAFGIPIQTLHSWKRRDLLTVATDREGREVKRGRELCFHVVEVLRLRDSAGVSA